VGAGGSPVSFTVSFGRYVAGSLQVFLNKEWQIPILDFAESDPFSGVFELDCAGGDSVWVTYQGTEVISGNTDLVDGFHATETPIPRALVVCDTNARLPFSSSPFFPVTAVTEGVTPLPYLILDSDSVILVTTNANPVTVTLPTAVGIAGRVYGVKKIDGGIGVVTVSSAGGTIDGDATQPLAVPYDSISVISNGTDWYIL
jgi:hypothetical protein